MSPFSDASSPYEDLRRELEAFEPENEVERAHRDAIFELLQMPGDVSSREHYEPGHLTASAFVVSPDDAALLLIHHAKLERWLQPGGHVEPGDSSLLHAARREVLEETGVSELRLLQGPFDVDVHEIPARGRAPAHRHFDVRYAFRASSWSVRGASDALEARWFPWEALDGARSDESVLRGARKLRRWVTRDHLDSPAR